MTGKIDPELVKPLEEFLNIFGGEINLDDIPAIRAAAKQMAAEGNMGTAGVEGVVSEDRMAPGPRGDPDVKVRIFKPTSTSDNLPAILGIHGGGYVVGSYEDGDPDYRQWAKILGCVIVSVDYRLAPEYPFPAPLEDCYAVLKWLSTNAMELGIDPARIILFGGSAGGGLAAGLALLARDRGEIDLLGQYLIYPMIDDRNIVQASQTVPDTLLWTRKNNLIGWRSYLGHEPGIDGVSAYAAPSRSTNLTRLPPAYIALGSLDLFLEEDLDYARRLIQAGVPTEFHIYPEAYHGFDGFAPNAEVSHRFHADLLEALKRTIHQPISQKI